MIRRQPFGKTGHESTRTLFGAAAISESFSQEQADRLLQILLHYGVNHIDTAASYGGGNSEARIGVWMEKHRSQFFLATKTGDRTYREAWQSIRRSLERLRVDVIDLIQLHNLVEPAEWETAMGPDGALKAAVEAREQGLVRFIGVTGHGLAAARMHAKSLERFPFDSVLLPWNFVLWSDPGYRDDFLRLQEICERRGVAVQTIKSLAMRPWAGRPPGANTWYEPLRDPQDIRRAVSWLLAQEGLFLNTVGDGELLPLVLEAASRPGPRPDDAEMEEMVRERAMQTIFTPTGTIP